jgi:hypothetical protein
MLDRSVKAFEFAAGRPRDIIIAVHFGREGSRLPRQYRLFFGPGGELGNILLDRADPTYGGSADKLGAELARTLLGEVRARVIGGEDYAVWYYSRRERDAVELAVTTQCPDQKYWARYIVALVNAARMVPDAK